MARRTEWEQQVLLTSLLQRWLDHSRTFATAVDNVSSSAMAGAMRKRRGVVPGMVDNVIVHRRRRTGCMVIAIEMKSPSGKCTSAQRAVREALLRSGCQWFECRSAHAAMVAIASCGVRFRKIVNADGTVERWRTPKLAPWEVPRRDPSEPLPQHPEVVAQRRATQRRWRARQRAAREAASLAERESPELPATHDANRVNFGA